MRPKGGSGMSKHVLLRGTTHSNCRLGGTRSSTKSVQPDQQGYIFIFGCPSFMCTLIDYLTCTNYAHEASIIFVLKHFMCGVQLCHVFCKLLTRINPDLLS